MTEVELSRIDYRARPVIELLNSFRDVLAYDCCAGHIQAGMGTGKPIKRYVPGLESNGNGLWTLDGNEIDKDFAVREFKKGFVGYEGVRILPINEICGEDNENLQLTISYLRFAHFYEPQFALSRASKQTKALAQELDNLCGRYEKFLGLRKVTSHGFATDTHWLKGSELAPENIDDLIQRQRKVDMLWIELADVCKAILSN